MTKTPDQILSPQKTITPDQNRWYFLVKAAKALNSTLEARQLLTHILDLSSQAVQAEAISLALIDKKHGDLQYKIVLGQMKTDSQMIRVSIDQGVVGWVARTGKPAIINDPASDVRFSGFMDKLTGFRTRNMLCVPLLRQDIVRGILVARNKMNASEFDNEDLDIFTALADQVAIALSNSELFGQAQRELRERMILCEVGRSITSSLNLQEVLSMIIDSLRNILPYDAAGIFLIDPKTQAIQEETVRGYDAEMSNKVRLKVGEGIMGWAAEQGKGIIVPNVAQESHYVNARPQTRSELAAPLKKGHRIIGVFNLESNKLNAYDEHDLDLLTAFASQASVAIVNARLFQETLEIQRLEHELEVARNIQKSFLPQYPPHLKGYDLAGMNIPSEEVGGDYYDFIPISEGQLGLVVADVSGKGIPGSLIMASFRASLLAEIRNNYAIRNICSKTNALLWESTAPDQYVTACYGVLDTHKRIFTYTNAGHNPPLLVSPDGTVRRLETGGLPLGFLKSVNYREQPVQLAPGDCLVLYTDGLTEVLNRHGEEFGEKRLLEAIHQNLPLSAEQMQRRLFEQVQQFACRSGMSDDLTIVIVKVQL